MSNGQCLSFRGNENAHSVTAQFPAKFFLFLTQACFPIGHIIVFCSNDAFYDWLEACQSIGPAPLTVASTAFSLHCLVQSVLTAWGLHGTVVCGALWHGSLGPTTGLLLTSDWQAACHHGIFKSSSRGTHHNLAWVVFLSHSFPPCGAFLVQLTPGELLLWPHGLPPGDYTACPFTCTLHSTSPSLLIKYVYFYCGASVNSFDA